MSNQDTQHDSDDLNPIVMAMEMQKQLYALLGKGIEAEEKMFDKLVDTAQQMLEQTLAAGVTMPPENFSTLVKALTEISLASTAAQKAVMINQTENVRAFIRLMDGRIGQAITAFAPLAGSLEE